MTDKLEKTNIEYFNDYMKMFVLDIKETFPEFNEIIDSYYDGEFFIKIKKEKPVKLSEVQGTNNVLINIFEDYEKKKF